MQKKHIKMNVF